MAETYKGSCLCGTCTFEAELDLSTLTSKCNCSRCSKTRWWGIRCKPEQFKFTSEDGTREELMTKYIHRNPELRSYFCKKCGVHPFGEVNIPKFGGELVSINVGCLDGFTPEDWARLPVRYCDGWEDNWANPPKETAYL